MRGAGRAVAVLSLLVGGCASLGVPREPILPGAQFSSRPGHSGLVIGARYGSQDEPAALISLDLARQTGFGLVLATGVVQDRPSFDQAYQLRVQEVAGGRLRLYVEIQGASRPETLGKIEIATVGVGRDEAWKLKTLFELIRDARLGRRGEHPRLEVLVTPLQQGASGATPARLLETSERAFQIDLPRAARTLGRGVYTEILAEFLKESARLLVPEGR